MEEVEKTVRSSFKEEIRTVAGLVRRGGEHMVVCGLDHEVVSIVIKEIKRCVEDCMKVVAIESAAHRDESPQGKAFFVRIKDSMAAQHQSLVYYYLEKTRECSCSLVLVSDSCLSLGGLEKRVKSRFNHRVFFFGFLPRRSYTTLYNRIVGKTSREEIEKEYRTNPGISVLLKRRVMRRYGIPEYSMDMFYDLLSPTHVALMIMAGRRRIKYTNCVSEFRALAVDVNELRGVGNNEILFYFLDLLDSGAIDKEGELLIDLASFKQYVIANRPLYLRKLIYRNT